MKVATTTTGRALPVLLSCVAVSLVLGILGMHVLTTHIRAQPPHAGVSATSAMAAMSAESVSPAAGGHDDSTAAATAGHAGHTDSSPGGSDGHDMGSTVMLCVAMLAAAGLLVLAALGWRRTPRLWAHLPDAPTMVHRFAFPRLATGPPPVWQFSVIRC